MELRRTPRAPIDLPVEFTVKGQTNAERGRAHDISLGGMFVITGMPPAFGAEVTVNVRLPGEKQAFSLPGVVRWTDHTGMGVQFRMLGVRETYAITEAVRRAENGVPPPADPAPEPAADVVDEVDVSLDE